MVLFQSEACQGEVDEKYEFKRLKQSMELVGFAAESQKKIFSVLSAVLLLGNIRYAKVRTNSYGHGQEGKE